MISSLSKIGLFSVLMLTLGCGGDGDQKPKANAEPWLPSYQAGMAKMDEGNFDAARREFDQTVALGPQFYDGWYQRGICLSTTGMDSLAALSFSRAIEIKPNAADAWFNRGMAFSKYRKWEDAIADLTQTEALKVGYPGALLNRGKAKWEMGDATGACDDFKQAQKENDPEASGWVKKACK